MPYTLLQITDCHLGAKAGSRLLGLDTDLSLQYVLDDMFAEFTRPDVLVCSGDLSNDHGVVEPYRRLIDTLPQDIPQLWLPGNHDDNACMQSVMDGQRQFLGHYLLGNWCITLLDSSIPEEVPGSIAASELARAIATLQQYPQHHHLMFMHHHLQPVGCRWLDTQVIDNAGEVLAALQAYPQLKMIICGHVHQDSHQRFAHIDLYSTPSTCIQFKPASDDFAVGSEMPGFRWLTLHDDGRYETGVNRIRHRELSIEQGSKGY